MIQNTNFKEYIAQRLTHTRELAREKREQEKKEINQETINEVFGRGIVEVDIKIPLTGNYVNIRSSIVERAKKENKLLRVIVPDGEALWEPDEWMNGAQITFQKFKYDTAMRLYGRKIFRD